MVIGGLGLHGALAARPVEEGLRLALVYATIQPQQMEVHHVQAVPLSLRHAIRQHAQHQIQVS